VTVAATAAVGLVVGLASTSTAGAAPASDKLAPGAATSHHSLKSAAERAKASPRALDKNTGTLPAGVPSSGRYGFLLKLSAGTTQSAYNGTRSKGTSAAKAAAKKQLTAVTSAQNATIAALPSKSKVMYRTHAVLAGVAVTTDVKNYKALTRIHGVTAVYPITPKTASNSYAVPLQGAPEAWKAYGDLGQNSTVAIIDTGVDYTHANFGGVGTTDEYNASKAQQGKPASQATHPEFPGPKVVGGYDLAGDDYDATTTDDTYNPVPSPDPYPLDCNGHGSHVAGTVAGYGENADGSTYTGAYNKNTPFADMRIGPGMAPQAKLYAYRVFGCAGSTDLVSDAIDMAADPNGDGDTSDHVDVINMSLGSDYGSPQDADSVTTNAASALGITMSVASGNAGDLYDVGGSPGDAPRAIAVAASQDAYSQVDALHITSSSAKGDYAAERSVAYDWATKPDLQGQVARVSDPANLDGCAPLSTADKAAVNGKIAFVEWTDVDADRKCGSAARAVNLVAAGAIGFIYADDEESFAAGITGSAVIPGVLVAKSGGDAIRTALLNHETVTVGDTTANGFRQIVNGLNDTLASFSSRGINDAGNVKPDVTAVGQSVFSTGNGTGNQGLNDSGTSMATPMVAGTAALVRSQHPDWNPEQVKADIMNTATADLYLEPDHTGKKYAPNRVGSGRIDVKKALDNNTLAYTIDNATDGTDNGTVSASFGPLEITPSADPTVLHKTIKVQNTSTAAASYDVAFQNRTTIPGAEYSVSPSSITVDPRSSTTVTLTLTVDPSALTKTIDPTVDRNQADLPREYLADASGLVVFKGDGVPNLRVPAYAAPRPASTMSQAGSVTLPSGAVQQTLLPLTGQQVQQGSGKTAVQSTVAGFELQASSGSLPNCTGDDDASCIAIPDQRAADLKYVGVTSDTPQLTSVGQDPQKLGLTYFSITTQGAWRTPAGIQEFDILIDADRDGKPDFVLFNTRLTDTDVMVDELVDLKTGTVADAEPINDRFGDYDTALFNSDTLVMPVATAALGLGDDSRIQYSVESYSAYQSAPLDVVGETADGEFDHSLTFDPLHPGVAVYGSYNGNSSPLLFDDSPGSVLALRRDAAAYAADHGKGALIVHFHNTVGNKAQLVSLNKEQASASLTMAPNPATVGQQVTGTVHVTGSVAGVTPTGTVSLRTTGGTTVGTAPVADGSAAVKFTVKSKGSAHYVAVYSGDDLYATATSPAVAFTVKGATPTVKLSMSPNPLTLGKTDTVTVTVTGSVATATGQVSVRRTDGGAPGVVRTVTLSNGKATFRYRPAARGTYHYRAEFAGDRSYIAANSASVALKIV
jgi:subtilisin family serine protease